MRPLAPTLLGLSLLLAAAAPAAAVLGCSEGARVVIDQRAQPAPDARVDISTLQPAWLEIDEYGRTLELSGAPAAIVIASPPRLARHGFRLGPGDTRIQLRDKADPKAAVRFRARLFCGSVGGDRANATLRLREAAAALPAGQVAAAAADELLGRIAAIAASAGEAEQRALALHLAAQVRLLAGRSAEAAAAFEDAERHWLQLGDGARAMAARAAWSEEAYALGRYDQAMRSADDLPPDRDGALGYYAARVLNCRCLALKYRGLRDQAARCYTELAGRLMHLTERLELANALLNLGGMQRDLGQLDHADASVKSADQLMAREEMQGMTAIDVASVRGRSSLLRADLKLRRGNTVGAVADFDTALREFDIAKAPRWRASTLIQLAALYGRLGAFADAYAVWLNGYSLYRPGEAPNRIATALLVLAQIQRDEGNPLRAAWLAKLADSRFARLGSPVEQELARIVRIRALTEAGSVKAAQSELRRAEASPLRESNAVNLARAAIAVADSDPDAALGALAAVKVTLSIADRLDVYTLRARALRAGGNMSAARALLADTREQFVQTIARTGNPLLRLLLQRRLDPLRRLAVDGLDADMETTEAVEQAVAWLPLLHHDIQAGGSGPDSRQREHDQALASELLLGQTATSPPSSVGLAAALSGAADGSGTAPYVPQIRLRELQAALDDGDVLFAVLEGNDAAYALWATRQQTRLTPISTPARLRLLVSQLADTLRRPGSPLDDIDKTAARLAAALFPAQAELPRARRLLVVASGLTDSVPWSLLPLHAGASVESMDVSLVHLDPAGGRRAASPATPLHVAVAAQQRRGSAMLAPLEGAASEASIIAAALTTRPVIELADSNGSLKSTLLDLFAEPGSRVHLAAHGLTRPGFVGHSGIWLDANDESQNPQFLGVLDLFEHGVKADLVVLNACDLGSGGSQAPGALAFTDTLVQLGAGDVVASLNSVSDGAAALWVPAFYRSLSDGAGPASALRKAQLTLRNSRAYRHPFYWSSLIHVTSLPLGGWNERASLSRSHEPTP